MSAPFSKGYKRYATLLLLSAYIVNRVDANIFTLLMQPIKGELHLSDTELGLLAGPAFLLFYAILGVPAKRALRILHARCVTIICLPRIERQMLC